MNVAPVSTAIDRLDTCPSLPVLISSAGDQASRRFLEFFAGIIRNPHTRRAYARAVGVFLTWCEEAGVPSITAVQPLHVATWIELQTREGAVASCVEIA